MCGPRPRTRSSNRSADTANELTKRHTRGLGFLAHIPLVGRNLGTLVNKINATAISASANATTSKTGVDQLAYLLGIVIVVIPAIPALAVYLPFRIGRMREARAVRRSLEGD